MMALNTAAMLASGVMQGRWTSSLHVARFERVDISTDGYPVDSLKWARETRKKNRLPDVQREVVDVTPIPSHLPTFLHDEENKSAFMRHLARHVVEDRICVDKVVTAGLGFDGVPWYQQTGAMDSEDTADLQQLYDEESDTRMVKHVANLAHNGYDFVVVFSRDFDVMVILVCLYSLFPHRFPKEVWLQMGTHAEPEYFPVHDSGMEPALAMNLIAWHALTGCDQVSAFRGKGKMTTFDVYRQHSQLLAELGRVSQSDMEDMLSHVREFVARIYDPDGDTKTCDAVRWQIYTTTPDGGKNLTVGMGPTPNTGDFHIKRAHRQAMVWYKALDVNPPLPDPVDCGYKMVDGRYIPVQTSEPALHPEAASIASCGCGAKSTDEAKCTTARCACRMNGLPCTSLCKGCHGGDCCKNPETNATGDGWEKGHRFVDEVVPERRVMALRVHKAKWKWDKWELCHDKDGNVVRTWEPTNVPPALPNTMDENSGPFFWRLASGKLTELADRSKITLKWDPGFTVVGTVIGWRFDEDEECSVFRIAYQASENSDISFTEDIVGEDEMRALLWGGL